MKILVISGFLGAGKTTFIKELCRQTGRDFCIFENEYSQTDIDKATLLKGTGLNIWELTENCICCSGKQDFATSVLTISNTVDPEFLIVEPTGVAKLSAVIENINKVSYERISLLQPLTIVDGTAFTDMPDDYLGICSDQLANAGRIVISKLDSLANGDDPSCTYSRVVSRIRSYAPTAEITDTHYSKLPKEWWDSLLTTDADGTTIVTNDDPSAELENFSLTDIELPSPTHLISLLDMLSFGVFGDIYRVKGYLPCGSEWLRFDMVDKTYSITGTDPEDEARIVFIGKDIDRSDLRRLLTDLTPVLDFSMMQNRAGRGLRNTFRKA